MMTFNQLTEKFFDQVDDWERHENCQAKRERIMKKRKQQQHKKRQQKHLPQPQQRNSHSRMSRMESNDADYYKRCCTVINKQQHDKEAPLAIANSSSGSKRWSRFQKEDTGSTILPNVLTIVKSLHDSSPQQKYDRRHQVGNQKLPTVYPWVPVCAETADRDRQRQQQHK